MWFGRGCELLFERKVLQNKELINKTNTKCLILIELFVNDCCMTNEIHWFVLFLWENIIHRDLLSHPSIVYLVTYTQVVVLYISQQFIVCQIILYRFGFLLVSFWQTSKSIILFGYWNRITVLPLFSIYVDLVF